MSKIFDIVKPGVVTGDDVTKLFNHAKENNFAIPAVNCVGTDSINAVLEATAEEEVILYCVVTVITGHCFT